MIKITKDEALTLRLSMPDKPVIKTRHHYYVEDTPEVLRFLKHFGGRK